MFDLEPSSTSSTPTSLVSQCLCPGTGRGGEVGCLQGWASPAALWGHQWLASTLGIGEETGCPGLLPLTQQDLAQVRLLPWPWLKSLQNDRRSGNFYRTHYIRSSEMTRKGRAD